MVGSKGVPIFRANMVHLFFKVYLGSVVDV